jgi:hypothetical protein
MQEYGAQAAIDVVGLSDSADGNASTQHSIIRISVFRNTPYPTPR